VSSRITRRVFAVFCLSCIAVLPIAGCGGSSSDSSDSLTLYSAQHEPMTEAFAKGFEEENGAKVQIRYGEDEGLASQIEQSFVARHSQPAALARDSAFEEVVIAVGDRIRVQGLALVEAHDAGERLYRDGVRRVRIVAHPGHPLTIGRR